ncbi:hypothetical protein PV327_001374 [Microctonus hyperodae]|uniref:Janus kinase and microtubule-interacting protein C-terminal domain-containing protein n=1 Tax=Microctonus hyperodae TaxID=165561 RepID=A0AA39L2X0_MICHY|nr:hypothetical protein PV327_001374 [Microctonus hyperodae]
MEGHRIVRDTVTTTKLNFTTSMADWKDYRPPHRTLSRIESNPAARKRRMTEEPVSKTPKTPRHHEIGINESRVLNSSNSSHVAKKCLIDDCSIETLKNATNHTDKLQFELDDEHEENNIYVNNDENRNNWQLIKKPIFQGDLSQKYATNKNRSDDSAKLRKTIRWLENNAKKLREDIAEVRCELHEEKKASCLAKRQIESAIKNARIQEAMKYERIIADLKTRLSQPLSCRTTNNSLNTKTNLLKEQNYQYEVTTTKKRLAETNETIRKLKSNSLDSHSCRVIKKKPVSDNDSQLYQMTCHIEDLQQANKKLENKSQVIETEKLPPANLTRVQNGKHELQMNSSKSSQQNNIINTMRGIRSKQREIGKSKNTIEQKSEARNNQLMKKLRENEKNREMHLTRRSAVKIPRLKNAMDLCNGECEAMCEVIRLRELAVEQQEMIEYLRQGLKERERKLDQLTNKKRKENFYRQWLELEPVAEVDDEGEHENFDSESSTVPSSLSSQSDKCQACGITREAYDALLSEVDKLNIKYAEEQQELIHAKSQVRDLEKALLQETRGSQNSRRALSDKLNEIEEREASLLAEISELKEQNELLEFRVLELEESEPRESSDTADSGVVSPEPTTQMFKDHGNNKQRDRVIATVIPYNSYNSLSPIPAQKSPLSLQESGIFNEDDDHDVVLTNCGTQTDTPAGELLHEVQRLQELRERIQERAVKVPVTPIELYEIAEDNRMSLYKNKIYELEQQLEKYAIAEEKRLQDQLIIKQREEDLLDENYRLTERVYWLTNEIEKYNNFKECVDIGTMTDFNVYENKNSVFNFISSLSHYQQIFQDILNTLQAPNFDFNPSGLFNSSINNSDHSPNNNTLKSCLDCDYLRKSYEEKAQLLAQTVNYVRRELINLESKQNAFIIALKEVDAMWLQFDIDHAVRHKKIEKESSEKTMINQTMMNKTRNNGTDNLCYENSFNCNEINTIQSTFESPNNSILSINSQNIYETEELLNSNNNNNINKMTIDQVDCTKAECVIDNSSVGLMKLSEDEKPSCKVSCVPLQYDEGLSSTSIMMNKSDADKKVRKQRRSNCNDHDTRARRVYKANNRNKNYDKSIINLRRLVLYPEICV